ncbi:MAG TPA: hypothetical protein PLY87_30430 [Planctomycetaceae bacterium]|nr:hypothetical protein [Planctomycetaceae bacterium]
MSGDSPVPMRSRLIITPAVRVMFLIWIVVLIGAYVLYSMYDAKTNAIREDVAETQQGLVGLQSQVAADRSKQASPETQSLAERISRLETALGNDSGIVERTAVSKSERAVQKVKAASLAADAATAIRHFGKLKKLQTNWAALEAALLQSDSGRRIAGNPKQLQLVFDIWQRSRPSAEQMVQWERQLTALTEVIDDNASDETVISITDEHAKLLSDLGKELATQAAEFEQQKLLLESIQRETSSLTPGNVTLADAIDQHQGQQDKAEAARLTEVRDTARAQAEKELTERITKAERELAEAKVKAEEQRIEFEKQQLAEETRLREQKHKADLAGFKEESKRVDDALSEAQLEREMQRDMNDIRGLLLAYTAPGFTYRPDDTKGPVSLSLIKSRGGLEPTRQGLGNLFFIACGNSDRPPGGMPQGIGGTIIQTTNIATLERVQELLIKYGELMVKKEMLAP